MTVYVGPTNWWWISSPTASTNCRVKALINTCGGPGGTLNDGSKIMCASNGLAILVAPSTTQVGMQWGSGNYNSTSVGTICCVSEWTTLQSCLITRGFNPSDWFVPNLSQLQLGYTCRFRWDSVSTACYWSSTENSAALGCNVYFGNGFANGSSKAYTRCVRAFRCVTY